jgi:hypothetical protein
VSLPSLHVLVTLFFEGYFTIPYVFWLECRDSDICFSLNHREFHIAYGSMGV